MKALVDAEYNRGRTASISDGELVLMLQEVDPDLYNRIANKA